ncbi:hypothetical protein TPENAI_30046 [Tenacibaculum litopenaei]
MIKKKVRKRKKLIMLLLFLAYGVYTCVEEKRFTLQDFIVSLLTSILVYIIFIWGYDNKAS